MLFIEPAKCDLNVRLSPDSGGIADVALGPKGADSVAKVPKRCATNFPLKDEPSDNRRSMYPQGASEVACELNASRRSPPHYYSIVAPTALKNCLQ
jgi:hypothetical protein